MPPQFERGRLDAVARVIVSRLIERGGANAMGHSESDRMAIARDRCTCRLSRERDNLPFAMSDEGP